MAEDDSATGLDFADEFRALLERDVAGEDCIDQFVELACRAFSELDLSNHDQVREVYVFVQGKLRERITADWKRLDSMGAACEERMRGVRALNEEAKAALADLE